MYSTGALPTLHAWVVIECFLMLNEENPECKEISNVIGFCRTSSIPVLTVHWDYVFLAIFVISHFGN